MAAENLQYNEPALLLLIAEGDQQAFALFVRPIFDRLYGFALSVTKSAQLAEEVVQDVFVRIWQHRGELARIENLTAWIYVVTRNIAYNTLRRQIRQPVLVAELDAYFSLLPSPVADELIFSDTLALVEQATRTLPPQQQAVFRMSRLDGLTLDEIAEKLGLSKETVKKHLTQALKAVRLYLTDHSTDLLIAFCAFLGSR